QSILPTIQGGFRLTRRLMVPVTCAVWRALHSPRVGERRSGRGGDRRNKLDGSKALGVVVSDQPLALPGKTSGAAPTPPPGGQACCSCPSACSRFCIMFP